jgi:cytochrome c-type biogenesis protein CcmE
MTQAVDSSPIIPAYVGETQASPKNYKFLAGGGLLIVLVIALIVYSTFATAAYYLTVDEIYQRGSELQGQRVRVSGTVVDGSERWNPQEITLAFSIQGEGESTLPVVFYGPRPDNFQRAASAILEGELLADGSFQADTLLLKCPSRYEEEPEEIFVKATH